MDPVCKTPMSAYEAEVLKISTNRSIGEAEKLVGRLSPKQKSAIESIVSNKKDYYTAAEISEQKALLKKSGFSTSEIQSLEKNGVFNHSTIKFKASVPTSVAVKELATESIDAKSIVALQKGEKIPYIIDDTGQMLKLKKNETFDPKTLWYFKNGRSDQASMIKEAGTLSFDSGKKQYVFKPTYNVDLAGSEKAEMLAKAKATLGSKQVKLLDDTRFVGSKTIDCLDVLSAQSKGKNFVLDRMISDNTVLATAILTSEVAGADRLSTEDGKDVVMADFIGTNINVLINGALGKHLVINDAGLMKSLGMRTLTGFGMIEMQRNVYNTVLENNAQERASDIATFDRAHFVSRLFINHYFDKFLVNKLPELVFNACQRDSKSKIFLSPRAVRIYERYASAVIYYGLRDTLVGE